MDEERLFQEIDYLGSTDEYLAFMEEHFGLESGKIMEALGAEELEKREFPAWDEVLADGMGGTWEEELAKKKRPQDYPKGWFVLVDHFRGKGSHKDFRVKMNDHLEGFTITDLIEGAIDETIDSLAKANKYKWNDKNTFKFQPDMGDRNVKAVAVKKATQPTVWLNVRDVVFPKGSVGATRFLPGVFRVVDQGMAYRGTQKPYFKEWFLDGKHFKGRLVFRLIAVRPEWVKKPKGKLQWQTWNTSTDPKGQLPYLLSPRGRSRKDVAPPEGESWLPPEWEKKIKAEHRWWPDSKSKQAKIKLMDEAYNDLIEKGEIKARKLKLAQEGGIIRKLPPYEIYDNYIPKEVYDKLHKKILEGSDGWKLGSPYLLSNDAPEEMKKWAAEVRKGLDEGWRKTKLMQDLQTDTAVILMTYGELKAKGWKDEKIIEQIAKNLLPIGFDLEYWKKKVREVLKKYGITIIKAMDTQMADEGSKRSFEDFEYLLHHIHIGEKGKEEIHHCLVFDHIANMFQQAHLLVKDGRVYIDGKLIKGGIFHVIKGLEPTQEVVWSNIEARENKIKPKAMKKGMSRKEKAEEW